MFIAAVDPFARWLALGSLVVAVATAVGAWRQALGQRQANAPEVDAATHNSGEFGTLSLTIRTNLGVRKVVVRVLDGSGLTLLGDVGAAEATKRAVCILDPASDSDMTLPARFVLADPRPPTKLRVTMRGPGFGHISRVISPPSRNLFAY